MKYFKDKLNNVWAFEDDVKDIYKFKYIPKDLSAITEEEATAISKSKEAQEEIK